MKGVLPASLIVMSWIVVITLCFYHIKFRTNKTDTGRDQNLLLMNVNETNHDLKDLMIGYDTTNLRRFIIGVFFVLNITLSITVNALYVWATTKELSAVKLFMIQVSLAVFRLVYSRVSLPLLSRRTKDRTATIIVRLRLLLLNNFLIPCIVVVFTSPSCLQVITKCHKPIRLF
jgi:hypothetical protein